MIRAGNAFRAKLNIFSGHLQRRKFLHFPSVQTVINDEASAFGARDRAAEMFSTLKS